MTIDRDSLSSYRQIIAKVWDFTLRKNSIFVHFTQKSYHVLVCLVFQNHSFSNQAQDYSYNHNAMPATIKRLSLKVTAKQRNF